MDCGCKQTKSIFFLITSKCARCPCYLTTQSLSLSLLLLLCMPTLFPSQVKHVQTKQAKSRQHLDPSTNVWWLHACAIQMPHSANPWKTSPHKRWWQHAKNAEQVAQGWIRPQTTATWQWSLKRTERILRGKPDQLSTHPSTHPSTQRCRTSNLCVQESIHHHLLWNKPQLPTLPVGQSVGTSHNHPQHAQRLTNKSPALSTQATVWSVRLQLPTSSSWNKSAGPRKAQPTQNLRHPRRRRLPFRPCIRTLQMLPREDDKDKENTHHRCSAMVPCPLQHATDILCWRRNSSPWQTSDNSEEPTTPCAAGTKRDIFRFKLE